MKDSIFYSNSNHLTKTKIQLLLVQEMHYCRPSYIKKVMSKCFYMHKQYIWFMSLSIYFIVCVCMVICNICWKISKAWNSLDQCYTLFKLFWQLNDIFKLEQHIPCLWKLQPKTLRMWLLPLLDCLPSISEHIAYSMPSINIKAAINNRY